MSKDCLALIVEDEPILAASLEATLSDLGFSRVRICTNIGAALLFVEKETPGIAFVDWKMGRETSIVLIDRLAALQVRTVIVTGYTESDVPIQRWPAVAIVQKPYSDAAIRRALDAMPGGRCAP
jgi:DNA-binding LytR/AlgR family response regulator